ncbi:hypothetical protein C8R45DRAFT_1028136, partial [Mycena sanguinolenta]
PTTLDALLPDWRTRENHPLSQLRTSSGMHLLTEKPAIPMPHLPQMVNEGNYIVILSRVAAWLGSVAGVPRVRGCPVPPLAEDLRCQP